MMFKIIIIHFNNNSNNNDNNKSMIILRTSFIYLSASFEFIKSIYTNFLTYTHPTLGTDRQRFLLAIFT